MKRSALAAIAVLISAVAAAAPVVEPPPVRLDVIVTDRKDQPIRNLTLTDFEVTDAGQTRPVDAVTRQSSKDPRLVAIFLDEYHVQAGNSTARARAAVSKFLET